jgi:hypothetical protein
LYFAENEGVAKGYREALSRDVFIVNGKPMDMPGLRPELRQAVKAIDEYGGADKAKAHFAQIPGSEVPQWIDKAQEAGLGLHKGHTYQVAIKAPPEHFLDWDKPFSEQPEAVKAMRSGFRTGRDLKDFHEEIAGETGEHTQNAIVHSIMRQDGLPREAAIAEATKRMREAGIPGVRYLDQGSRGKGDGTRNYVVFDDHLIDILKKYGIAGLAALPAAGAYHFRTQDVDHDPFSQ